MTSEQRTRLQQAAVFLSQATEIIQAVKDQIEEAYEELSESAQEGTRGEAMQEDIANLDDALTGIESAESSL